MRRNNALLGVLSVCLAGCVTSRIEDDRATGTGISEGESIVVMAKSYHQGNETESDYITCVERALGSGSDGVSAVSYTHLRAHETT